MDNSTYVALSLAQAMRRDMDVTTNNIANANTAGFKGEHIVFENYVHQNTGVAEDETVSFVVDKGSYTDTRQGPVAQTGNPLDVALLGQGWLSYETPEGQVAYGRDGRFSVDAQGNLVTLSGARVLDAGGGGIAIPQGAGEIAITRDGTISSPNVGVIAQLGVFNLPDLQGMERLGNGMIAPPAGAPAATRIEAANTEVVQGSIEGSNVSPVTEMTRMIEIQRAYERAINLMSGEDDLRRDTLRRLSQTS
ncbi:MAG: flagellar basal-body rod protein FlgF [Pseudomonadota bacterium]|nr:flagellar basal-body rod protein FlgF [Pseudomonadota bacterium]